MDNLLASGLVPDYLVSLGIKSLLKKRLNNELAGSFDQVEKKRISLINELKSSEIAIETDSANEQHYQVPTEFYDYVLGKYKKYSCCLYKSDQDSLDQAEKQMLDLYIERGQFEDGQAILDLGCGWGSFSLYAAQKFKGSKFTLVSNSKTQKIYIDQKAKELNLENIEVITCNVNELELSQKFDRVISIEMFEHVRNYQRLLEKISHWLNPEGKLFVHIFTHKDLSYKFEVKDQSDWMSKYFFSGGIMPSEHLLYYFQKDMKINEHWRVNGQHYEKTAQHWLDNMDKNKDRILEIFQHHYKGEATKWFHFWRIFFMSCRDLWGYEKGSEWYVCHYLFEKV